MGSGVGGGVGFWVGSGASVTMGVGSGVGGAFVTVGIGVGAIVGTYVGSSGCNVCGGFVGSIGFVALGLAVIRDGTTVGVGFCDVATGGTIAGF